MSIRRRLSFTVLLSVFPACAGDDAVLPGDGGSTTGDVEGSTSDGPVPGSTSTGQDESDSSSDDSSDGAVDSTGDESTSGDTTGPAVCGNGVVEGDEECDLGAENDDQGACKTDCMDARCGDGLVGPGEACDDGDGVNWNECSNMCALPSCGDDLLSVGEECDDGEENADDAACTTRCLEATCGDGLVWAGVEECDDANAVETDECLSNCVAGYCGDGIVLEGVETCDDGNLDDADECPGTCQPAVCGDGFMSYFEDCDLGDENAEDGSCLPDCSHASCGDGFVWAAFEECDDQNALDTDACVDCHLAYCGDGYLHEGVEECDDGNAVATDDCTTECQLAVCGDGFLHSSEECDDGNGLDDDACVSSTCQLASCGDGFLQTGVEDCDDGNAIDGDACGNDCTVTCGPPGQVIYVDDSATGANNGTSWQDAYTSVFFALQSAATHDELWVAEGTYVPVAVNAPVASLVSCVAVYGGFVGTEASVDERPMPLAATIFSGDFAGDDGVGGYSDNSFHVVVASSVENVLVDGVTITGGNASDVGQGAQGGGAIVVDSTVVLEDIVFLANVANQAGGGLRVDGAHVTVSGATFDGNSASVGGAVSSALSTLDISATSVLGNVASGSGGGLVAIDSEVSLSGCFFQGNTGVSGGAAYADDSVFTALMTTFTENSASNGGALNLRGTEQVTVSSCSFDSNTASARGGAMWLAAPGVTENTSFAANTSGVEGGAIARRLASGSSGGHTFDGCTFVGNSAGTESVFGDGGAISASTYGTEVINSVFDGNSATRNGGGVYVRPNSSGTWRVESSQFLENTSDGSGGAIYSSGTGGGTIELPVVESTFVDNVAQQQGGAIANVGAGGVIVNSGHFEQNSAGANGGALYGSEFRVTDSSFRLNSAATDGGAVYKTEDVWSRIRSSSFYENSAGGLGGGIRLVGSGAGEVSISNVAMFGNGTDIDGEGNATITYTCSEEFLSVGAGNLLTLTDPFVVGVDGEIFLNQGSVCVDNGDTALATADYTAIGLDWATLTTGSSGALDVPPVDMGRHYQP